MSELTETEKEKAKKYYPLPALAEKAASIGRESPYSKYGRIFREMEVFR
jgi:hypothetical protein